jgi:hypothetical protein
MHRQVRVHGAIRPGLARWVPGMHRAVAVLRPTGRMSADAWHCRWYSAPPRGRPHLGEHFYGAKQPAQGTGGAGCAPDHHVGRGQVIQEPWRFVLPARTQPAMNVLQVARQGPPRHRCTPPGGFTVMLRMRCVLSYASCAECTPTHTRLASATRTLTPSHPRRAATHLEGDVANIGPAGFFQYLHVGQHAVPAHRAPPLGSGPPPPGFHPASRPRSDRTGRSGLGVPRSCLAPPLG